MEKKWVNNKGKGWYMTCKGKDMQGNEIVGFMNVGFKKGQEPQGDSAYIEILNGFHTPYQYTARDNTLVKGVKYFIQEYKLVEKETKEEVFDDTSMFGGEKSNLGCEINIEQTDLPFYGG